MTADDVDLLARAMREVTRLRAALQAIRESKFKSVWIIRAMAGAALDTRESMDDVAGRLADEEIAKGRNPF